MTNKFDSINLTRLYVILEYYIKLLSDYLSKIMAYWDATNGGGQTTEPAGDAAL